jgi:signal transduction histidine kinase
MSRWFAWLDRPSATKGWRAVRVRLTALYTGLFAACAAVLLVLVNWMARRVSWPGDAGVVVGQVVEDPGPAPSSGGSGSQIITDEVGGALTPREGELLDAITNNFLTWSIVAMAIMVVVSAIVGWLLAGRVLAPMRRAYDSERQLVANMSHELRTPLTTQRAVLELAVGDDGGPAVGDGGAADRKSVV